MNPLRDQIQLEILRRGPMSLAKFMDFALYAPGLGYYEREETRVGRQGDFYTSVSVGSLFGELLAFQFAQWLDQLAESQALKTPQESAGAYDPHPTCLVEAGAHDGRLALDVLTWLRDHRSDVLGALAYWIIEPSERRQAWQAKTLEQFHGQVRWFTSWKSIPVRSIRGVIFSNELLDAFPVQRFTWDALGRRWHELGVALREGEFAWVRLPADHFKASSALPERMGIPDPGPLLAVLPDGFVVEWSPWAEAWWEAAAACLAQGWLLTFDYGLTAQQWFSPERAHGTLRSYHHHRLAQDVLANPGDQDITAHVNFTALQKAGERAGLRTEGLGPQSQFLMRAARRALEASSCFETWSPQQNRQLQTLTHPEHLGHLFKVLVQSKRVGTRTDGEIT